jgi:hypothetical protein
MSGCQEVHMAINQGKLIDAFLECLNTSRENAIRNRLLEAGYHLRTRVLLFVAHPKVEREWCAPTGSAEISMARDYYVGSSC